MNVTEIYERLTDILRDIFDDDTLIAVPTMVAKDVDGWDSLNNIRVVLSVKGSSGSSFQLRRSPGSTMLVNLHP